MTREVFDAQIGRLIVLKGWPDDVEEYFRALSDIPNDVFTGACDLALRTRTWFPVPAELRSDCDLARPRVEDDAIDARIGRAYETPRVMEIRNPFGGESLRITSTHEWKYYCDVCGDTGTQALWCGAGRRQPWVQAQECGSFKCKHIKHGHADYGHEWMKPCPCAETNRAVIKRKEREAKYAAAPTKRGVA